MTGWNYPEMFAEHDAQGHAFHVEAMAFRGASVNEMLAQAAKGFVIVVDDAPVSSVAATVAPRKAA
jgi:hypothetical protein